MKITQISWRCEQIEVVIDGMYRRWEPAMDQDVTLVTNKGIVHVTARTTIAGGSDAMIGAALRVAMSSFGPSGVLPNLGPFGGGVWMVTLTSPTRIEMTEAL